MDKPKGKPESSSRLVRESALEDPKEYMKLIYIVGSSLTFYDFVNFKSLKDFILSLNYSEANHTESIFSKFYH